MKLIEITLDYPYTGGEPFCKQELDIAEQHFDEIVLISMSGHFQDKNKRDLPQNVRLINARKSRYEFFVFAKSALQLLSRRSLKEVLFARNSLKVKESFKDILKEIFIYYYYSNLLRRVFKHEKVQECDIVYSYWMAAPAYFIAGIREKCFKICRAHRFDCFIDRGYQPFRREIIAGLDCIISISEAGKKDIENRLLPFTKVFSDKIMVSRLGINRDNPAMDISKKNDGRFILVSCSNINSVKRLDLIVDALMDIRISLEWIHIGDGELGPQIREQAKKLEKNKCVKYQFLGALTQREVYSFYEKNPVNFFVNCSDSEGIPVSIMEAMSFGIPVIARNVGGNAEIVNTGNGILLDEAITSSDLRKAILWAYELDYNAYSQMRENAFNSYKNCYQASINYHDFFIKIKKLAKEKKNVS